MIKIQKSQIQRLDSNNTYYIINKITGLSEQEAISIFDSLDEIALPNPAEMSPNVTLRRTENDCSIVFTAKSFQNHASALEFLQGLPKDLVEAAGGQATLDDLLTIAEKVETPTRRRQS